MTLITFSPYTIQSENEFFAAFCCKSSFCLLPLDSLGFVSIIKVYDPSEAIFLEQTVFDLPDGRVLIDYGPVTMVLLAEVRGKPQPSLCRAFFPQLQKLLTALHNDLPQLRRPPAEIDGHSLSAPGQTMLAAVRAADDPTLTPYGRSCRYDSRCRR